MSNLSRPLQFVAGALLLLATWGLSHHYKGVTLDGDLYAFQAMARLVPSLRADLYLTGDTQDDFTFFSPIYALAIRYLGLWGASATLFVLCTSAFLIGVWSVARSLWNDHGSWMATATCIVIVGGYGAYNVFAYSEDYLTARSMAEAMVVLSLACHLRSLRWLAWIIATAALLIHPLMALPGLLLLMCLSVPVLYAGFAMLTGVLATLTVAWLALHTINGPLLLRLMDGDWLQVVRERSQFLFLQYWHPRDWESHASPIISLVMAAMVTDDPRGRRLCLGAIIVGFAGLIVAGIASSIGPVAILLQGQAWRWCWITVFVGTLTLAPTTLQLWKTDGCGAICAIFMVASWTVFRFDGTAAAAAALCLLLTRRHINSRTQHIMQLLAYVMVGAILSWMVAKSWSICAHPPSASFKEPFFVTRLREVYALQIPALAIAWLGFRWLRSEPNLYPSLLATLLLLLLCCFTFDRSFENNSTVGTEAEIRSLSGWRDVIPAASNVMVIPGAASAAAVWFSLQRPSYLSVNQSAGVVFSRKTALEVQRRSEVLLPVMQPDWKINSQLARATITLKASAEKPAQTDPLTAEKLSSICRDPALGFVIAKEQLGFGAIRNVEAGSWKDWNLYDCTRISQSSGG